MTSRRRDRSTQPLGSSLRAAEYLDAVVRVKEDGRRLANRLACEVNHPVVPLGERGPVAAAKEAKRTASPAVRRPGRPKTSPPSIQVIGPRCPPAGLAQTRGVAVTTTGVELRPSASTALR